MAKRKRTFKDLKVGSYFWEAGIGCVCRRKVASINYNPGGGIWTGKVRIAFGYHTEQSAYVEGDSTEFITCIHRWFTDKEDARKCAYQLIINQIRDKEREIDWMKLRARTFRENFLPDVEPQEDDWVLTRINRQVHEELERQKREGKEFLSDDEVDAIIKKVLAEKNF